MTGYVVHHDGSRFALPPLSGWELRWTEGTPCDSFTVSFPGGTEDAARLRSATRFQAVEQNEVCFTGVVDEYEIALGPAGRVTTVSGRGMGALLLDNEAGTTEFDVVQLEDIMAAYVTPLGIQLGEHVVLPALRGFGVDSGDSCYAAVYGFARWAAEIMPRFDRLGRLVLLPPGGGKQWTLDESSPVLEAVFTDRRYGVISQVVENDRSTGRQRIVSDEGFLAEGGSCRRVMSVYSKTAYRATARRAEQVLALSGSDRRILEVTLPGLLEAMPGDTVSAALPQLGVTGRFVVAESRAMLTGQGLRHTLTLRTW